MDVLNILDVSQSPVSLAWVGSILASSMSIYLNLLSPSKFTFVPARLKEEPWRLLLTFCFLGPPLMALIQNCYFMVKTVGLLEEVYTFSYGVVPQALTFHLDEQLRAEAREIIHRNRSRDFAYFIVQLGLTIATTVWLLSFFGMEPKIYFLGPALQRIMLYIRCRLYPEQQISIMGVGVKSKYAFAVSQFLDFLISDEYIHVMTILSKSPYFALRHFFTSQILYEAALGFCVGHFWWYLRYFYLDVMYNDSQDDWGIANSKVQQGKLSFQELLRYAITPIWYKYIMQNLGARQLRRILTEHANELAQATAARTMEEFRKRLDQLSEAQLADHEGTRISDDGPSDTHAEPENGSSLNVANIEDIATIEGSTGVQRREIE